MQERRDPEGRMPYRLYYKEAEIDAIMEGELRRSGIARIGDGAVDVDAFIENYLHVTPEFVALPAGCRALRTSSPTAPPDADLCCPRRAGRPAGGRSRAPHADHLGARVRACAAAPGPFPAPVRGAVRQPGVPAGTVPGYRPGRPRLHRRVVGMQATAAWVPCCCPGPR